MASLKRLQRARTSKDWDDALAKLKRTGGPGFFAYFTANWLGDDWRSGWSDLLRVLRRDVGLENTNNATESIFKMLSYTYLNRKKAASPDSLVLTIVLGLFVHFKMKFDQFKAGARRTITTSKKRMQHTKANGEATLHKHLESIVEVVPQLFAIGSYHVNTDLGTCSCPYYIYTGKQCKHIVAIALLQGLADDSYPTWLRCISPTIFCDPTVFSDNDEGRCEALGITGPPGRPPTLEPRPRRRRKNQLLSDDIVHEIANDESEKDDEDEREKDDNDDEESSTFNIEQGQEMSIYMGAEDPATSDDDINDNEIRVIASPSRSKKFVPAPAGSKRPRIPKRHFPEDEPPRPLPARRLAKRKNKKVSE